MKINFSQVLMNLKNEPLKLKESQGSSEEIMTLWRAACSALFLVIENMTGETKYKHGKLAEKIYEKDFVEVTAEEIAMIKKAIGDAHNSLIVMRAWDLLEQKSE